MSKHLPLLSLLAIVVIFLCLEFIGLVKLSLAQSSGLLDLPGTLSLTDKSGGYYDFVYSEGSWSFTGTIKKPSGGGPFKAVIVSHGKGSAGFGFCAITEEWFANYLRICPDYTHAASSAGGNDDPSSWAGSPENVKRATKALDILVSQELASQLSLSVDSSRLFMWGNSMGAMVTVATVAEVGSRVNAAAYTAGGLSDGEYLPNDPSIASGVEAPFLMLHALNDGTVDPSASRRWRDALINYDKTYQLVWFKSGGHNMMHDPTYKPVIGDFLRSWFENPRPSLSSISPTSGNTGTSVLFSGSNFGSNTANLNRVIFYKYQPGTISSWSSGIVSASVPQNATSGPVRIMIPLGPVTNNLLDSVEGGMRSNGINFTKDGAPLPTSTPTPPGGFTSTPTPTQPRSDADNNGLVDGVDFLVWMKNYGQGLSGRVNGDFNDDKRVDMSDYVVWISEYQ